MVVVPLPQAVSRRSFQAHGSVSLDAKAYSNRIMPYHDDHDQTVVARSSGHGTRT